VSTALVVDDSLTTMVILSSYLKQEGLDVLTAKNAVEALAKINRTKPDVIILDVVLPDRSGFEICRELKAKAETRKIPIVMCSTKATEMDKFWGRKQGADAYLVKPVDQEEFVKTVQRFIGR